MNESAQTGFSNASHYDAHRPSYPEEAVSKLLKHLGVADQPKAQIVELASGTGKFTELLVKRGENVCSQSRILGDALRKCMRADQCCFLSMKLLLLSRMRG